MTFLKSVKSKVKSFAKARIEEFKENQRQNAEFNRQLQQKIKVARQEAFTKEAVKQAKLRAKDLAKLKFNPPKGTSGLGSAQAGLNHAINFGVPKQKNKEFDAFDPLRL